MSGAPQENVGLRKIGLRRSPSSPDTWDIYVAVRNYGAKPHDVDLELQFGKSPVGAKRLQLAARRGGAGDVFLSRPRSAVILEARLNVQDAFPQDDRAVIELPGASFAAGRGVFQRAATAAPACSRPIRRWTQYLKIRRSTIPAVKADVVVLDRFAPHGAASRRFHLDRAARRWLAHSGARNQIRRPSGEVERRRPPWARVCARRTWCWNRRRSSRPRRAT